MEVDTFCFVPVRAVPQVAVSLCIATIISLVGLRYMFPERYQVLRKSFLYHLTSGAWFDEDPPTTSVEIEKPIEPVVTHESDFPAGWWMDEKDFEFEKRAFFSRVYFPSTIGSSPFSFM
jgi:hypothetical protein